jgi:hypothetical protein
MKYFCHTNFTNSANENVKMDVVVVIIQFNSIYLCAKLNSHRPITKLAQVVQRRRRRRRRRS